MKQLIKFIKNCLASVFLVLVGLLVFQNSVLAVSASEMNLGFYPNSAISEIYTYDYFESSDRVIDKPSSEFLAEDSEQKKRKLKNRKQLSTHTEHTKHHPSVLHI